MSVHESPRKKIQEKSTFVGVWLRKVLDPPGKRFERTTKDVCPCFESIFLYVLSTDLMLYSRQFLVIIATNLILYYIIQVDSEDHTVNTRFWTVYLHICVIRSFASLTCILFFFTFSPFALHVPALFCSHVFHSPQAPLRGQGTRAPYLCHHLVFPPR